MYEGNSFLGGPDFSSLAEVPPPSPEKKLDDDDDDIEEDPKPKTLLEYLKKDTPEESKEEKQEKSDEKIKAETEEAEESAEAEEPEIETDPAEAAEEASDSKEMTGEEEQLAAAQIIKEREEAVRAEVDQAKTAEAEKEALAAGVFLDKAKEEVEDGQPVEVALDNAKAKALESLGIEQPEADEEPEVEITPPPEAVEIPEPVEPEEAEESVAPPATAATSGAGGTTPPTPPPPTSGLPPMPPAGGGHTGPGGPGGPGAIGGNILPAVPNIAPAAPEDTSDHRISTGGAVLAGGLVGYMIGRRRGRIKTEKKLLPIQHKLEKELADLQGKIAWHEAGVRSLVHEQVSKTPEPAEQKAEHLKPDTQKNAAKTEQTARANTEPAHSEQLGRFAMVTERPSQSEAFRTPERLKPVDLMTVPELLVLAERIEIEQSTVRKLYEAKRLNYEGLRRIIQAYLRGERYDQLVRDNLLTPEKYAYPETLQTTSAGATQVGNSLPGQTNSANPNNPTSQFGSAPPPANPWQAPDQIVHGQKTNIPQTRIIVAGIILTVLLLIFIVAR